MSVYDYSHSHSPECTPHTLAQQRARLLREAAELRGSLLRAEIRERLAPYAPDPDLSMADWAAEWATRDRYDLWLESLEYRALEIGVAYRSHDGELVWLTTAQILNKHGLNAEIPYWDPVDECWSLDPT